MNKILIIYATDYQNTFKMAEAVAVGVNSVANCVANLKSAEQAGQDDLVNADALILGTPVHMGSPDWRVKKFIDAFCSHAWVKDMMVGRVGGVFASGSGFGGSGGGAEMAMLALLNNMAELGMILIPLPKSTPGYAEAGLQWGPYARTAGIKMEQVGVSSAALQTSRYHGANIARATIALAKVKIFVQDK